MVALGFVLLELLRPQRDSTAEISLEPGPPETPESEPEGWWAAFGIWRGDRRLFARIATAIDEVLATRGFSPTCQIDFELAADTERFSSVDQFNERVTTQALRSFRDAYIRASAGPIRVEVGFRKRRHSLVLSRRQARRRPPGVFLLVSTDDAGTTEVAREVRDAVAQVIRRGARQWLSSPEMGHSPDDLLARGLRRTAGWRASAINSWLFVAMFTVALGQGRRLHASELVAVFIACVIRAALGFATVQGTAFTDPFLPTIEISDASTTVRALRTLFGFVVVGVGAGVLSAYLAHLVHLGAAPTLQHLRNKKQ